MLKDEYIKVDVHLFKEGKAAISGYEVRFSTSDNDYGNGTYMMMKHVGTESYNLNYDIRYDKSYDPGMSDAEHIRYVINFIFDNLYTGKDGSWEISAINARIKVDLDGEEVIK